MVEIVSKVRIAEEEAEEIRKTARQQAKQLRDNAESAGKQLLEREAQRAAQESAQLLSKATKDADEYLADCARRSRAACDDLLGGARVHMDKAANFIVGRIVNSL